MQNYHIKWRAFLHQRACVFRSSTDAAKVISALCEKTGHSPSLNTLSFLEKIYKLYIILELIPSVLHDQKIIAWIIFFSQFGYLLPGSSFSAEKRYLTDVCHSWKKVILGRSPNTWKHDCNIVHKIKIMLFHLWLSGVSGT